MAFAPVQSMHPALAALDPATSSSTAAAGALATNGRRSARRRLRSEGTAPGRNSRKGYDDEEDDYLGDEGTYTAGKRALHPPSNERGMRGAPLHRNGDSTTVAADAPSLSPVQLAASALSFRGLHGVGGLAGPAAGLPPGARGRHLTLTTKGSAGLDSSKSKADLSLQSNALLPDDPEVCLLQGCCFLCPVVDTGRSAS